MEIVEILLPCQGNPLQEVWLPPQGASANLLTIPPSMSDQRARNHARSLGIEDRTVPIFKEMQLGSKVVVVWILWLEPGDAPKGLRAVTAAEATAHPEFGTAVTAFVEYLASRR